jgi:hypothetical protein
MLSVLLFFEEFDPIYLTINFRLQDFRELTCSFSIWDINFLDVILIVEGFIWWPMSRRWCTHWIGRRCWNHWRLLIRPWSGIDKRNTPYALLFHLIVLYLHVFKIKEKVFLSLLPFYFFLFLLLLQLILHDLHRFSHKSLIITLLIAFIHYVLLLLAGFVFIVAIIVIIIIWFFVADFDCVTLG